MSYSKTILVLANSRKLGGHCVAGREWSSEGPGEWIRPVTLHSDGALSQLDRRYADGGEPALLDIVRIRCLQTQPHGFQTENYLVDLSFRWQKLGHLDPRRIAQLCEEVDRLWINGYNSTGGLNDRFPVAELSSGGGSLRLVRPENVRYVVAAEFNRRVVRASFQLAAVKYCLAVTDWAIEAEYIAKPNGVYPAPRPVAFCVSVGLPWLGHCYKVVAAVIPLGAPESKT